MLKIVKNEKHKILMFNFVTFLNEKCCFVFENMKRDNDFVKAKIISIGDELLIGQVINTNAAWLGNIMTTNGIEVISTLTIGDGERDIVEALDACSDVDIIIMTGGLGPTADDITKPTLCKYFNTELEFCQDAYDNVMSIFTKRGYQMTERNRGQAFIPKACKYIPNRYGTAPCMWFEKDNSVYISMPGVPFEMKNVFEQEILPQLLQHFKVTPYINKVVMTTGVGESFLADKIKDWEDSLPDFLSLAYLPQYGMVRLRLEGRHPDREFLQQTIDNEVNKLTELIGEHIFGYDEKPIAEAVFDKLKATGKTLASAESCTGGTIAKMITAIPGSSEVFKGTVVSYATSVKEEVLGVNHDDVERYTVVSQQVAEQMATGVKALLKTDYAVATTGVAGPGGGTEENPVGTVWIAVAGPKGVESKKHNFGRDRGNNIERAAITALDMVRRSVILFLLMFVLFVSCTKSDGYKKKLDVPYKNCEPHELAVVEYNKALFDIDTANFVEGVSEIMPRFPELLGDNIEFLDILGLKSFVTDTFIMKINALTEMTFPDISVVSEKVQGVYQHLNYYYPNITMPVTYSYVSGINYENGPVMIGSECVMLSLDYYLSNKDLVYDKVGMPRYLSRCCQPASLTKDLAEDIYDSYFNKGVQSKNVLMEMIAQGKRYYFIEAMDPSLPDSIILGYSSCQMEWAQDNEGQIWATIVGNNMLYANGFEQYRVLFGDGPFTAAFSENAPARLGDFIGLQIVRSFMSKNDESLQNLMEITDCQDVFQRSQYKPRK